MPADCNHLQLRRQRSLSQRQMSTNFRQRAAIAPFVLHTVANNWQIFRSVLSKKQATCDSKIKHKLIGSTCRFSFKSNFFHILMVSFEKVYFNEASVLVGFLHICGRKESCRALVFLSDSKEKVGNSWEQSRGHGKD
jgi:hypothetical protein